MWQPLGHRASSLESCIRNEIATLSSMDECLRLAMGKLGTARTFRRPCSGLETGGKRRREVRSGTNRICPLVVYERREREGYGEKGVFSEDKGEPREAAGFRGAEMTSLVMWNLNFHQGRQSCGQEAWKTGHDLPMIGREDGSCCCCRLLRCLEENRGTQCQGALIISVEWEAMPHAESKGSSHRVILELESGHDLKQLLW